MPLAHKDMFHRAGELAEYGSTLFRGHRPVTSATVIARLDAAGAIDCGRLNMVEFALGITGHNAHTGHPKNAWDPARITGGSTSGGATSVAARLIPATLGSDTGGSIRIPASLCNLVGIKPTYGRVSRHACMPLSFSLDHVGPLARSAEDCALILAAIAGRDPNDPTTSSRPVPDYRAGLARGIAGVRIARATGEVGVDVDPEIGRIADEALGTFGGLGVLVEDLAVPSFAPLNALRRTLMLAEGAAIHLERMRDHADAYVPQTTGRMAPGFALQATDYVQALMARGPLLERFCATVFDQADILAMPTSPVPTPDDRRHRHRRGRALRHPRQRDRRAGRAVQLSRPAGGQPAGRLRPQRHAGRPPARRQAVRRGPAAARGPRLRARHRGGEPPPARLRWRRSGRPSRAPPGSGPSCAASS